jgi:tryptophan synthase alpha chain
MGLEGRFKKRFSQIKERGEKIFIPFTLLGYPDEQTSFDIIKAMIDGGASALELGLSFSDPLADGPLIQAAGFATIESGFTVADAFKLLKRVRAYNQEIPIGLLVYYNMVLAQGIEQFYQQASEAGVDGVLIVDLPPESADEVLPYAIKYGIAPIFIISPLTDKARLEVILRTLEKAEPGFLYIVSRLGTTGTREDTDSGLNQLMAAVKHSTGLPLCVGFGISSPAKAKDMYGLGADGVITGSKIIDIIANAKEGQASSQLESFIASMVEAAKPL